MVTPQDLGFDGVMDIDSDSDILEASLSEGSLTIDINNGINTSATGAPSAVITISEIVSSADNQPLVINTGAMFGQMDPQSIDLSGYKILMSQDSQTLNYTADVETEYAVGTYSLLDSIEIDIIE